MSRESFLESVFRSNQQLLYLKNSGHEKLLLQNINQYYGISCHTKFEYNATSGF